MKQKLEILELKDLENKGQKDKKSEIESIKKQYEGQLKLINNDFITVKNSLFEKEKEIMSVKEKNIVIEQKLLNLKKQLDQGSHLSDKVNQNDQIQKEAIAGLENLISEKDKELFFNALINPKSPNENLKAAKEKYDNLISA